MKKSILLTTYIVVLVLLVSCKKEVIEISKKSILINHAWSDPEIIRSSYGFVSFQLPLFFYDDGTCQYGMNNWFDWELTNDNKKIMIGDNEWDVIELNDSLLHINEYYFKENVRTFGMEVKFKGIKLEDI